MYMYVCIFNLRIMQSSQGIFLNYFCHEIEQLDDLSKKKFERSK